MKTKKVFLFLKFLSLISFVLLFTSPSYAKISPESSVGIWLIDSDEGDTVKDSSENGFDGEIKDAEWVDGKNLFALSFEKGDTVSASIGSGMIEDKVTITVLINFQSLAGQQNYFSLYDGNNRYVPYKTSGNELHFWSNNWDISSGFVVSEDTWYYVANVYDGKKVSIWIDGELKVSNPAAGFTLAGGEQKIWIATDKGGWESECIIDEVGLFNIALNENDIKKINSEGLSKAMGISPVESEGKISITWGRIKDG